MTINKYIMPLVAILALFGTIGVAQLSGNWVSTGKELVNAQNLAPADLRGWMTIRQAADGLHLPVETIYRLAGVPAGASVTLDTPLKQLEDSVPGFDVSSLRDAVAAYLAGAAAKHTSGQDPQAAPAGAVPAPGADGETNAGTGAPVPTTIPSAASQGSKEGGAEQAPQPPPAGQILPAKDIKGMLTLREVSEQCGVPLDKILAAASLPANTDPGTQIKALKDVVPGFEVQTLRDAVAGIQR